MGAAALLTKLIPLTAKTAVTAAIKKIPGVETVNDKLGTELEKYLGEGASELIKELTKNKDFNREYTKELKASVKESITECFNTSFRDDEIPDLISQIPFEEYEYDNEAVKADVKRHINEVLNSAGYTQFNTSGIDDLSLNRFLETVDAKMNAKINTNEKLLDYIMALRVGDIHSIVKIVNSKSDKILTLSDETKAELEKHAEESGYSLKYIIELLEYLIAQIQNDDNSDRGKAKDSNSNINDDKGYFKDLYTNVLFLHNKNDTEAKTLKDTYTNHDYKDVSRKNRGLFALERTDGESEDKEDIEAELCRIISNKIKKTIFVTGEPGIGKSSLVAFLANEFKDDINVIIMKFKSLSDYFKGDDAKTSIKDAIGELLNKKIKDFSKSEFYTIILDGFDEFAVANKTELLKSFCENIGDDYENISLIVTSRYSYNNSNNIADAFSSWYIIKKFNNKQIKDYYFKLTKIELDKKKEIPKENQEVLGIPVILYMAVTVAEDKKSKLDLFKEKSIYGFYDMIFDLEHGVFNRFFELRDKNDSENRQHKDYKKPENINAMHNLFQMLSFRLFENNFGDIKREIYTNVLTANIKDESGNKYELPEDIMEVILSYPIDDNDEYINFAHRSIGEYFMAIRIISAMKVIYGRKSFSGMQADELKHYIDDFVRRMTALLRKGTVSGNESMVHYFLKQMLSKEYSASARSAFHQNLSDMDFLSRAFSRMLEAGFTNYTIDEASDKVYVDINETAERLNFEKKREQELNCFRNVIDLIQIVRNVVNGSEAASENGLHVTEGASDDRLFVTEEASDDRLFVTEAIAEGDAFKRNFEYYVSQSDFSVMNLSEFRLLKLDLSLNDLSKGIFRDAVFKDCDLTGANLEFADLRGARITGCNLTGTRLGDCRGDIHSIRNEDNNNLITASTDFTGACKAVTSSEEIYVGGTIEFGRYPQNADGTDTDTPILWRVLDIVDGHALLLSDKILDAIPYHDEFVSTSWEKCDLNAWLNKRVDKYKNRKVTSFYYDAFNSKEQSRIVNINSKVTRINSDTGREKGCEKIFLLSYEELLKYFDRRREEQKGVREDKNWHSIGGEQAVAYCTDYVINKLDKVFADTDYLKEYYVSIYESLIKAKTIDEWWLRSLGLTRIRAMYVYYSGDVSMYGTRVDLGGVGVRPALWINLKS